MGTFMLEMNALGIRARLKSKAGIKRGVRSASDANMMAVLTHLGGKNPMSQIHQSAMTENAIGMSAQRNRDRVWAQQVIEGGKRYLMKQTNSSRSC